MRDLLLIEVLLEAQKKHTSNLVYNINLVMNDLNKKATRVIAEIRERRTELGRALTAQEFQALLDEKIQMYVSKKPGPKGGDNK